MWYIVSPAAAARSTSGRPDGDETRLKEHLQERNDGEVSCSGACVEDITT